MVRREAIPRSRRQDLKHPKRVLAVVVDRQRIVFVVPKCVPLARATRQDVLREGTPFAVYCGAKRRPWRAWVPGVYALTAKTCERLERVRVVVRDAPPAGTVLARYVLPVRAWRDGLGAHQREQIEQHVRPVFPEDTPDACVELGPIDREGATAALIRTLASSVGVAVREVLVESEVAHG